MTERHPGPPLPDNTPFVAPSVGRAVLTGVAWSAAGRWLAQAATWASTLLVARLLTPSDYGIVGMAAVMTGLLRVVSEMGIAVTVITLRGLSRRQIEQLHGLALLTGIGACAMASVATPAIAWFFHADALVRVIPVLALAFLISGPALVPAALLQRDMRFARLSSIEIAQAVSSSLTVLVAAWAGWGYWALVAGTICGSTVFSAAMAWCAPLRPAWPHRVDLGHAFVFTRQQLTGNLAWYAYSNADFAVAGRVLGPGDLGVYSIAWTVARVIPERVIAIGLRVVPSVFSALQHDPVALRRWVLAMTEAVAIVAFPALIGLSLVSGDVVVVVLGSKWIGAAMSLRLLALYAAFDVMTQIASRALIASGHAGYPMRIGVIQVVVMPVCFVAGALAAGPTGIAAAWLLVSPVVRLALVARMAQILSIDSRRYANALAPALRGSVAMTLCVLPAHVWLRDFPAGERLALLVALGVVAYAVTLLATHGARLKSALALVRSGVRPMCTS